MPRTRGHSGRPPTPIASGTADRPLSPRERRIGPYRLGTGGSSRGRRPPEGSQGTGRRPKAGKAEPQAELCWRPLTARSPSPHADPTMDLALQPSGLGGMPAAPARTTRRRSTPGTTPTRAPPPLASRLAAPHAPRSRPPGSQLLAMGGAAGSSAAFGRGRWSGPGATMARKPAPGGWLVPWSLAVPSPPGRQGSARNAPPGGSAFLASACGRPLTALWWCSPRPAPRRYGSIPGTRGHSCRPPTAIASGTAERQLSPRERRNGRQPSRSRSASWSRTSRM
jgi:hypothetical protein